MGYTHYWDNSEGFTGEEWVALTKSVRSVVRIAKAEGIGLTNGVGQVGTKPEITQVYIILNGLYGHETFNLGRVGSGNDFCKTARKPYDTIVVAILALAAKISTSFSWWSDGESEDHKHGVALAKRVK